MGEVTLKSIFEFLEGILKNNLRGEQLGQTSL